MTSKYPKSPAGNGARRGAVLLGGISIVILFAAIIAVAAITGLYVNLALVFGIAATILLGVGLMALSFYSSRSGVDENQRSDP